MSDEDPQERCDICHRLVPLFTLVIEAGLPHRRLCSLCRFDHDPTDPEQQGYARGFAQGIAFANARCGCEACNRLQSPSAPQVLGQVPPRPERGYAIDPFPSVRGSLLDPETEEGH